MTHSKAPRKETKTAKKLVVLPPVYADFRIDDLVLSSA
jgi:hypothetical protein